MREPATKAEIADDPVPLVSVRMYQARLSLQALVHILPSLLPAGRLIPVEWFTVQPGLRPEIVVGMSFRFVAVEFHVAVYSPL